MAAAAEAAPAELAEEQASKPLLLGALPALIVLVVAVIVFAWMFNTLSQAQTEIAAQKVRLEELSFSKDKELCRYYLDQARLELKYGKSEEAIQTCTMVIERFSGARLPGVAEAYNLRGQIRLELNQAGAKEDLAKAKELGHIPRE